MDIRVLTCLCGGQWSGRLRGDCGVWARLKLEWLRRFIPLKNGVPSHDCIAYVICRLSPEGFSALLYELDREGTGKDRGRSDRGGWQNRPWLAGSREEPQSAAQGQHLGGRQLAGARAGSDRGEVERDSPPFPSCWRCWSFTGAS